MCWHELHLQLYMCSKLCKVIYSCLHAILDQQTPRHVVEDHKHVLGMLPDITSARTVPVPASWGISLASQLRARRFNTRLAQQTFVVDPAGRNRVPDSITGWGEGKAPKEMRWTALSHKACPKNNEVSQTSPPPANDPKKLVDDLNLTFTYQPTSSVESRTEKKPK